MSKSSLRIGVDARPLAAPHSGIGRYTHEILSRLTKITDHRWFLYSYVPLDGEPLRNAVYRHADVLLPSFGSLHAQIAYPMFAARDRLDVFWSPRHHLPLRMTTPAVVTIHDLVWKTVPETMGTLNRILDRALMPASIRMADAVVANSHSTANDICREFPGAAAKTEVIYLGGFNEMPHRDPLGHSILFVGTFEPRKNLERLIEAFMSAQGADSAWELVLAGNQGWGIRPIREIIDAHGASAHVRVVEGPDDRTLHQLYAEADILALPALYEGFGLPLVEGMSHGCAVLCSNISSLPEVAGDAAILVDPRSSASIAEGISKLTASSDLRRSLGCAARKQASKFRWDSTAAETLRVLERVARA